MDKKKLFIATVIGATVQGFKWFIFLTIILSLTSFIGSIFGYGFVIDRNEHNYILRTIYLSMWVSAGIVLLFSIFDAVKKFFERD